MNDTVTLRFRFETGDLRKASYYLLFLRNRRALLIMTACLLGALLYSVVCRLSGRTPPGLLILIAAAYLIWGLVLFARTERSIREYVRQPSCLLGEEYFLSVSRNLLVVRVEKRGISFSLRPDKLESVLEMGTMFLLFRSAGDFYVIPRRAISEEQRLSLRRIFSSALGRSFLSRFA